MNEECGKSTEKPLQILVTNENYIDYIVDKNNNIKMNIL